MATPASYGTTDFISVSSTNLGPLTTVFTPPKSCLGTTAVLNGSGKIGLLYSGGIIEPLLRLESTEQYTDCYPRSYPTTVGTELFNAYYSPGVCPAGYTTAATRVVGEEIQAACCQSGLVPNRQFIDCSSLLPIQEPLTVSTYFTYVPNRPTNPLVTGVTVSDERFQGAIYGSIIQIRYRDGEITPQTDALRTSHSTSRTTASNSAGSITRAATQPSSTVVRQNTTSAARDRSPESAEVTVKLSIVLALLAVLQLQ